MGGDNQLPQLVAVAVDGEPPGRHRGGFCGSPRSSRQAANSWLASECHKAVPLSGAKYPLRRTCFLEEVAPVESHSGSQIFDGIVIVAVEPSVPPLGQA